MRRRPAIPGCSGSRSPTGCPIIPARPASKKPASSHLEQTRRFQPGGRTPTPNLRTTTNDARDRKSALTEHLTFEPGEGLLGFETPPPQGTQVRPTVGQD